MRKLSHLGTIMWISQLAVVEIGRADEDRAREQQLQGGLMPLPATATDLHRKLNLQTTTSSPHPHQQAPVLRCHRLSDAPNLQHISDDHFPVAYRLSCRASAQRIAFRTMHFERFGCFQHHPAVQEVDLVSAVGFQDFKLSTGAGSGPFNFSAALVALALPREIASSAYLRRSAVDEATQQLVT